MITINDYDRRVYDEIRDFLPNQIIDCHTHVYLKEFFIEGVKSDGVKDWPSRVADECSIESLMNLYSLLFPDKKVTPVIFGTVANVDYDKNNEYISKSGHENNFPQLYVCKPSTTPEQIETALMSGFSGIKPYLNNAPKYIPANEIRIYDFLLPEQMEVINKNKAAVMLHIARDDRIKDPVNIGQLLEIDKKYPDAKVIIAHVGRAYAPEDFGDAFEQLKVTKNLLFDFSANTLDSAIKNALETFGPKRVLFGSDLPIVVMRMKRIVENGSYVNVVPPGLYGDLQGVPHMREAPPDEQLSFFMYEIIRAAKRAMTGFSKEDVENVFYNNAKRIFKFPH